MLQHAILYKNTVVQCATEQYGTVYITVQYLGRIFRYRSGVSCGGGADIHCVVRPGVHLESINFTHLESINFTGGMYLENTNFTHLESKSFTNLYSINFTLLHGGCT